MLEDYKTTANREYFACESAVVSVLKLNGFSSPAEHKRIWKESRNLEPNPARLLQELYDLRLQADYGKQSFIVPLSRENVEEYLKKVRWLIAKLKEKYGLPSEA